MEQSIIKHINTCKLILAPMVRICNTPFRLLCLKYGADLLFTEEIIAKKLRYSERVYNSDLNTYDYYSIKDGSIVMRVHPNEKGKLILQIGASDPEDALKATLIAKDDIIGVDLNMGCPKHFSTHGNMGAALLLVPDLAKQNLVQHSGLPVSCKIRLLEDEEKTKHLIETLQSTGIQFFTVHLRLKDQPSNFKANWKALTFINKIAKIPFNANGDILSPQDIYKLNKLNMCSGFMIARGAIHNPKIFDEYRNFSFDDYLLHSDISFHEDHLENDYEELPDDKTTKRSATNESEVRVSNKLAKIFERKYYNKNIDILFIIKEYIELALKCGNYFHNSKYTVLYILKTHKKHMDLFKKITQSKSYKELCIHLNIEELYENCVILNKNATTYYDGTFYKNRYKEITKEAVNK